MKKTLWKLCVLAAACFAGSAALAQQKFDDEGALILRADKVPLSGLVSQEFRDAYVAHLKNQETWPLPPPPLDAPKSVWDKFDADADRLMWAAPLADVKKRYPAKIEEQWIDGVHVAVVTPANGIAPENRDRVLIHAHGGAFFMGRGLVAAEVEALPVAYVSRIKVVTIDYRMAPYFHFPAASEDVEKVYRSLLKTYKPASIGMFGCSAGGALTAQAVTWFESKNLPRPGAVGIFCSGPAPYGKGGDSRLWNGNFNPPPATPQGYMQGADVNDPRAYPAVSDAAMSKFPPVLLYSGTRAPELSQVVSSHAQFLRLGVDSQLYIQEGGDHGAFVMGQRNTPEAKDTLAYIARWFDEHLAK
jgi:epsilon-lactone hydrolase